MAKIRQNSQIHHADFTLTEFGVQEIKDTLLHRYQFP